MTTLGLAEMTDYQRAGAATAKAKRVFPPEIATAIAVRVHDGMNLPAFVNRTRWQKLIHEVMTWPETEQPS